MARATKGWLHGAIVLAGCLILSGGLEGQHLPASVSVAAGQPSNAPGVRAKTHLAPADAAHHQDARVASTSPMAAPSNEADPAATPSGVRRITLEEAQQTASLNAYPAQPDKLDSDAAPDPATTTQPPVAYPTGSALAQVGTTAYDDGWHYSVTPYLWVPWMYGTIGTNTNNAHFYATPGDIFSHFRFGLLGLVDARYKRVVIPLDLLWMRLKDNSAVQNVPMDRTANVKLDMFLLTPKIGYRVIDTSTFKVDALTGFRYWHIGENLQFTPPLRDLNASRSQNWVDPLVGGRILGRLYPKIDIAITGDVGGWGTGSQLEYQTGGLLGYRIKKYMVLQAGYRYLTVDYRDGNRILNLNSSGPLFGLTLVLK